MKAYYKSKTFWVGVIEVVVGVLLGIQGILEAGVPLTIVGILKIVLRVVTTDPITFRKVEPTQPSESQ